MKYSGRHTISVLIAFIQVIGLQVSGQQSNTLYLQHDIPQSNLLNPAVQLACKWYVGIPGLASAHLSYSNTAFTYNDLAGTDTWNLEGVLDQMHRVDLFSAEVALHPISVGYKYRSFFFTFNLSEKLHIYQLLPGSLAETIITGNASFVGRRARYNALRPGASYYRDYSLGVSRVLDEKWILGARARLLFGKAGLYNSRSRMGLTTTEDNFSLLAEADYLINSSFPLTITEDASGNIDGADPGDIVPLELLLNRGNPGVALDLGAIYRFSDEITLSASILDVGVVRWRTDLNKISVSGDFEYTGTSPGTTVLSRDFANQMADSLLNAFEIDHTMEPFTSFLQAQVFLGGSYQMSERIMLGAVNRNLFFRNKMHSSITLSATADLADRFLATLSWSYLNNSIRNIGAGVAYHGKGFQFHVVSDNLLGFFYPFNTRSVNLRAGFNLMFGCPRNKQEQLEGESYGRAPKGGDCSWTGHQKIRKKYQKKSIRRR